MSRDYQEYCPACEQFKARSCHNYSERNGTKFYLLQCLNCGVCHLIKETTAYTRMKTIGTDEEAWNKARCEAERIRKKMKKEQDSHGKL